jgi:PAS domain S-box-containing protein
VKLPPLAHADARLRWLLVLAAAGLFIFPFLVLFPIAGPAMASLSVIPAALASWFFGSRTGLLIALLSLPLNTLLLNLVGDTGWDASIRYGGIPSAVATIAIAVVVGAIRDLSDKLRSSEESARQLTDAAFEAIVIHDKGIILDANLSFCRIYGYERSEIIGMNALQLTAPEDQALVQQKIASGDTSPYEGAGLRKDGTRFRAQVMGRPVIYKGRTVRVTAIRDITESHQTQAALEVERNLVRTLIANLPHRIFYKDSQGRYVIINNIVARSYGLDSPEDAVGSTVFDYYPEDLAAKYHADDMAVIQSGQALINREETSIDENGNSIWLLTNKIPVRDGDGQVVGLIGISIDITEREQAKAQRLKLALVEEKAELLREFLNTVSHDFKTPLTIINTTTYLLERLTDPAIQKDKLEIIKTQTLRLSKLIQDMLMMSQLESVPIVDFQRLDINLLLREIEASFRSLAEQKHLVVSLNLATNLPPIPADRDNISRVLVNLVENALTYTQPDGMIKIQTVMQDDQVVIEVSDTGIGISETDLPNIFDLFYRADKARSAHTAGSGLGLAIVKKIIEMHHGSIEVESQPGVGSTFRVRLPSRKPNTIS